MFKKLLFLVLVVLVLLGTILFFIFFNPDKQPEKEPDQIGIPTGAFYNPSPPMTPNPEKQDPELKKDIANKLPYVSREFNVEYLVTSDTFIVTINESPYEQNRKRAEDWLKSQGLTNLEDYDVLFNTYNDVR